MSTRNINVTRYDDEYALFGKALPYLTMLIGAGLAFAVAVVTRLGIWAQINWGETSADDASKIITWIIIISAVVLSALAWKLFRPRDIVHFYVSWHAVVTTILVHAWLIMAIWQDIGEWMFGTPTVYAYFYGGIVLGLSWCIRRWAYRGDVQEEEAQGNVFAKIGLGEATHLDKNKSHRTENGAVYRMKLQYGKTIEDAKGKIAELAHIAGKPRALVHVSETEDSIEGQVDIMVLDGDPFKERRPWKPPVAQDMGASITHPIEFATYDTHARGMIYIAGKDGGSSQHFLTVGMSGTGKSKAWQAIYGTLLSRREVSVIFGDPAKGMQTGEPLASKLAWFATTEEDCKAQIDAVVAAVPARTNYLTSKGLSQWEPDCGLNLLIFHLEEAARFAEIDDLVELLEAARSAGVVIVLSLQKATGDRLKTSARYNLGANMCFGVKAKRDAEFGLSEYARKSGASPHFWQDRNPGHFYLEAAGIDPRMAAHELESDWINTDVLRNAVDSYSFNHMDDVTATALGDSYTEYRNKVDAFETDWQQMRLNRGFRTVTKELPTQELRPAELSDRDLEDIDLALDEPVGTITTNNRAQLHSDTIVIPRPNNLGTDPEDTAQAIAELEGILTDWMTHGKMTFTNKEVNAVMTKRGEAWVSRRLHALKKEGRITKDDNGFWVIVSG